MVQKAVVILSGGMDSTTLLYESIINIQGNDLGHSNNEKCIG